MTELQRVRAPKVLGILSIIFGGLVLLDFLGKLEATVAMGPPHLPDAWPEMRGFELIVVVMFYSSLVTAAFSTALVAIGIGQLRYRRWALVATRVWSVLAIVFVVAQVTTLVALSGGDAGMVFMLVALTVLLLPYPIVLLRYFARESVRDAMTC